MTRLNVLLCDQRARFLIAGGYNTVAGVALYFFFFGMLGDRFHYLVLLVMNHMVGTANGFLSMKLFAFRAPGAWFGQYLRYNLVFVIAFCFNLVALPFLVEVIHMTPFAAQGLIMVIVIFGSFFAHQHFSFGNTFKSSVRS